MMKKVYIIMLLCTVLGACHKKDLPPQWEEKTGDVSGTIFPIGSASTITILREGDAMDKIHQTVPDASTGKFSFSGLEPGTYALMSEPANGFDPTDNQSIEIEATKETVVTLSFNTSIITTPDIAINFKSGFSTRAHYKDQMLTITKFRSEGKYGQLGYKTFELTIQLDKMTGPGTYVCDEVSNSLVRYVSAYGGTIGFKTWGSKTPNGIATVIITTFDANSKKVSGKFNASLPAIAGTRGTVIIADQAFDITY